MRAYDNAHLPFIENNLYKVAMIMIFGEAMKSTQRTHKLISLLAASSLLAAPFTPVLAQVDDEAPSVQLNLPNSQPLGPQRASNVRRATAIVNGEVITGSDVDERLALLLNTGEATVLSPEQKELAQRQVLSNLIDETLQIQEAEAKDIKINNAEIDQYYASLAQRSKSTVPAFGEKLSSIGSSSRSLRRQIQAEIAWSRVTNREISPFVNVGDEEINALLDRLTASQGTTELRVGEIYLAATPENAEQVFATSKQVMTALQEGGSFTAYARQFSQASTASVGGDLGWVRPEMLPASFLQFLNGMEKGQLAGPVEAPGGISILYLIDKRQILGADPSDTLLSVKQISVDFPAGLSKSNARSQIESFSAAVSAIQGCGQVESAAAKIGAQVTAADNIRLGDLPPALQQTMSKLNIGEASPPFGSPSEGVRAFVLCGRDAPKAASLPSRDQIRDTLEQERIGKRAQLYLRDLRNDAIIEYY